MVIEEDDEGRLAGPVDTSKLVEAEMDDGRRVMVRLRLVQKA